MTRAGPGDGDVGDAGAVAMAAGMCSCRGRVRDADRPAAILSQEVSSVIWVWMKREAGISSRLFMSMSGTWR